MKHWTITFTVIAIVLSVNSSRSVHAQEFKSGDDSKVIKPINAQEKSANNNPVQKRRQFQIQFNPEDVNGPSSNVRLNRELRYVGKFKKLIESQIEFTAEEREKVFKVIDDHIETVVDKFNSYGENNMKANAARQRQAQRNGKGFNTYDEHIAEGNEGQLEIVLFHMKDFFKNITEAIPEKHAKQFDELYVRWDLTHHGPLPDDPIRRLNRITKSPLMKLSDETTKEISVILRAAMKEVGPKGRLDPVKAGKAAAGAREKIFKLLTKEQQEEVDKSLRLIDDYRKIMEMD